MDRKNSKDEEEQDRCPRSLTGSLDGDQGAPQDQGSQEGKSQRPAGEGKDKMAEIDSDGVRDEDRDEREGEGTLDLAKGLNVAAHVLEIPPTRRGINL